MLEIDVNVLNSHVYTYTTYGLGPFSYHYTHNISVRIAQGKLWLGDETVYESDSRIETDISNIDDDRALQQVNTLETKEYHYIDPVERNEMKTIGYIAQEVKQVCPNAVSIQTKSIPDEMRNITEPQWEGEVLTIPDLDLSANNVTGICKFYVRNGDDDAQVCKEIDCEKDADGNKTNRFKFEESYTNVFLYGKEVNDFHTIDKNQIFALHHSAIQELSRKNDKLEAELAAIKAVLNM
jgi:hypothetical protein